MATRTIRAVGSVQNSGNVASELRAHLVVVVTPAGGGAFTVPLDSTLVLVLGPGEVSGQQDLQVSVDMNGGDSLRAFVVLDRLSPQPAPGVASAGPAQFTEPTTPGGELVGFGPVFSARFGMRRASMFRRHR